MTISDLDVRALFTGNGSTVTFAINFDLTANSEIDVYLRDDSVDPITETLQTISTHYTLTGDPATAVVMVTAPASTEKLLIIRSNPLTQDTDYETTGQFPADSHEEALDKLTRLVQELDERADRSIKFAKTSVSVNFDVPDPVASKVIAFNSAGTALELVSADAASTNIVNADISNSAAIATSKLADNDEIAAINKKPGTWNIGLAAATTATANDSIKITSASGTALSSSNVGLVTLPGIVSGTLATFEVTADVTIDLTGAHWGAGTLRDLTDHKLVVYALNNNGALVWGVSQISQNHNGIVLDADDSATATSITSAEKVLVGSALSADAQALMVGWFKANFDDTGGASEDIWAVQTGDNDLNIGHFDIPVYAHYTTNAGGQTYLNSSAAKIVNYEDIAVDTHNAVTIGAAWKFTAPVAGLYSIEGGVEFNNASWTANTQILLDMRVNTSPTMAAKFRGQVTASITSHIQTGCTVALAKGQFIDLTVVQTSGVTLTSSGNVTINFINVSYVGTN